MFVRFRTWPDGVAPAGHKFGNKADLVKKAHELRAVAVKFSPADEAAPTGPVAGPPPTVLTVRPLAPFSRAASVLYQNRKWFELVQLHLSGEDSVVLKGPSDTNCARANTLAGILLCRFQDHIMKRVPPEKRSNFAIEFVIDNLDRVAVIAVAINHCLTNFDFVAVNSCLLNSDVTCFHCYDGTEGSS